MGTRGIVVPFSTSAYKASVAQAINVAKEAGCDHIVLSTGGKSESFGIATYPELPEEAFVEMGDFVGFALKQCKNRNMRKVTLVGMMGKFSKVAQGVMMVHSKSAPVDFGFLAQMAEEAGAPQERTREILTANTASQVGDLMADTPAFFEIMCANCCRAALKEVGGGMEVETIIITMKGSLLGRVTINDTSDESDRDRG